MRVLIIGASRGIGLALARRYAAQGHEVIATCRKRTPEMEQAKVRLCEGVDVTTDAGAQKLTAMLGRDTLDIVVVNAGILEHDALTDLDVDAAKRQLETNALGPLRMVKAVLGNLVEGSKIALVTSRMGSIADNGSGGSYGYRMSKAALNAMGVSLAHDLKKRGVAVAILHPGFVKTDMTGGSGNVTAEESATGLMDRIDALTLATSGTFWHMNGEVLPW